jgi:hypothetical protein
MIIKIIDNKITAADVLILFIFYIMQHFEKGKNYNNNIIIFRYNDGQSFSSIAIIFFTILIYLLGNR